jgi:hypothetical protein
MRSKVTFVFSLVVVFCLLAMPGLTAAAHNLPQWTQANPVPPNELMANINAMTEFKGELYAGTMSAISAVPVNSAVYRSKDGMNWKKVSQDGFGDPLHNTTIGAMIAFKDKLYVGTGDWFRNGVAQLWRTRDGATWEPIDTAGFGDSNNFVLSGLTTYRGSCMLLPGIRRRGFRSFAAPPATLAVGLKPPASSMMPSMPLR